MSPSEFSAPQELPEAKPEWSACAEQEMVDAIDRGSAVLVLACSEESLLDESGEKHITAWVITGREGGAEGQPLRFTGYDSEAPDRPRTWSMAELEAATARTGIENPLLYPGAAQEVNPQPGPEGSGQAISFRGGAGYGDFRLAMPMGCGGWASDGGYTC
jgi:hypothetical protein